jgi:hypothetical protein
MNNDLVYEDLSIVRDINLKITELLTEYDTDTSFKVLVHREGKDVSYVDVIFPTGEADFKLSFAESLDFGRDINEVVAGVCLDYGYEIEFVKLAVGLEGFDEEDIEALGLEEVTDDMMDGFVKSKDSGIYFDPNEEIEGGYTINSSRDNLVDRLHKILNSEDDEEKEVDSWEDFKNEEEYSDYSHIEYLDYSDIGNGSSSTPNNTSTGNDLNSTPNNPSTGEILAMEPDKAMSFLIKNLEEIRDNRNKYGKLPDDIVDYLLGLREFLKKNPEADGHSRETTSYLIKLIGDLLD